MQHLEKFVRLPARTKTPTPIVDRARVDPEWGARAKLTQAALAAAEEFQARVVVLERQRPVFMLIFWALVLKNRAALRDAVVALAAEDHGVTPEDILGTRRKRAITRARWTAVGMVYIARPDLSLPTIARLFGLDHTSVLYALDQLGIYIKRSVNYKKGVHRKAELEERRARSAARKAAGYPPRAGNAKLTAFQVAQVRVLLARGVKRTIIARRFGVSSASIRDIAQGRSYKNTGWQEAA